MRAELKGWGAWEVLIGPEAEENKLPGAASLGHDEEACVAEDGAISTEEPEVAA